MINNVLKFYSFFKSESTSLEDNKEIFGDGNGCAVCHSRKLWLIDGASGVLLS